MKRWIYIDTFAPQVSDWLYDEGSDADAATYEAKLNELKTLTGPLYRRVKEHME
jgi:hypoxia up-regulated 1